MFRAGFAEAIGTFFITFFAGAVVCMDAFLKSPEYGGGTGASLGMLGMALATGMAVMFAVYSTGGISGAHLNPAITFGLMVIGKCESKRAWTYIFFQLVGGIIGGIAILGMFSMYRNGSPYLGTPGFVSDPDFNGSLSPVKALGVEMTITFVLMMVVLLCGIDKSRSARQMFGLCIGMAVFAGIVVAGQTTGAAMNPARYFGPAVVSGQLGQLWVYFVGPILGAVVASFLYKFILETKDEAITE